MSVEALTYAALGSRLNISPVAARSLARRLRLPRARSDDGKAVVSVDLADIQYTPRPKGGRSAGDIAQFAASMAASIAALQADIARLEASAAEHRADFERERERTDRLTAELMQATAELSAAKDMTARLESATDSRGQAARRLGHLAATIVEADRKACR